MFKEDLGWKDYKIHITGFSMGGLIALKVSVQMYIALFGN